jgi:cysteine-rich repeat protein
MKSTPRTLRCWSLIIALMMTAAGCASESDSSSGGEHGERTAAPEPITADEKAQLDEIQQELLYRPACNDCAKICKPLRGYFKTLCTRACQKVCVNPCEACKNNCRLLQGSQKQQCLNNCASSSACGGSARCGNGRIEGQEMCDDGNTRNGDGCSATCQVEPPRCGDGRREGAEACDDGNTANGDGCSSTCTIEPPPVVCGDGRREGSEACDDGNTAGCDGCGPTCRLESCGDAVVCPTEQCDDGNTANNDGCSNTCGREVCGDGITQPPREQCDDGNTVNTDACHNNCTTNVVACGDGDIDANEQCDDGNTTPNDGCSASCQREVCGDGIVQPPETCDDRNTTNNDGCAANCTTERCGDGTKQASEQCEDGNTANGDGCSSSCRIERCGDGVVRAPEECDDGNTVPNDGCDITCTSSPSGPSCEQCRNANCRDYLGVDLVAGCFEAINPEFGAPSGDPAFIQDCVNLVSCARVNSCAYDALSQAPACYCGSNMGDPCTQNGPAADAPCVAQYQAASRTTVNAEVLQRFVDLSYPSGWAFFVLDCERQSCNSAAVGNCTKPGVTTSSKPSYVVPVAPGVTTQALLTVGDSASAKPNGSPYRMVGIPDGLGAFDNNDGTFTLLANHELGNTSGIARQHGGTGAFVSRWQVRKSDLGVIRGEDLIRTVQVWDRVLLGYQPGANVSFGRFCSADLPARTAFYNPATSTGFDGRLFLNGEENGNEGKAWAHGLDGTSWELPRLGKASWENIVASPHAQAKTISVGLDDSTPGQVYVYVGTKSNTGSPIDRAGLTNGTLYGVAVAGAATEPAAGLPAATTFELRNMGNDENATGAALDAASISAGVTRFNRPEDGAWDPVHPRDFYFVTTNSATAPSRLWRLRFNDIAQPELGGVIEMLLDGTEGQVMLDNIGMDARGHILMQEDVGNNPRLGQLFRYDVATDTLTTIAQHDPALFTTGAPAFLTSDEESSGAIDATDLLGPGWWLIDVQAHFTISGELVEGGQFIALFDPGSVP